VIKPTIGLLSSLSDLKHIQHARLSLVVLELTEVEILQNREIWLHSEEGNTLFLCFLWQDLRTAQSSCGTSLALQKKSLWRM